MNELRILILLDECPELSILQLLIEASIRDVVFNIQQCVIQSVYLLCSFR
jgi:hypothetical protein